MGQWPFPGITKVTDPDGAALTYTYNAAGDLVKVTERTGATTAITYDTKHNITDIVDARGIKAQRNDYDASGRLIATTVLARPSADLFWAWIRPAARWASPVRPRGEPPVGTLARGGSHRRSVPPVHGRADVMAAGPLR